MADQHRATDLQWVCIRARASDNVAYSTILELRDRIEALEAAASTEVRPTVNARITRDRDETGDYLIIHDASPNHPAKPDSSLKGRIKSRMIDGIGSTWEETSASVLVEVAAWLRDHYGGTTASTDLLEQEAER